MYSGAKDKPPHMMGATNYHEREPTPTGPSKLGRCLYSTIIGVVTLSLVMTCIVTIFTWYQDSIEAVSARFKLNENHRLDWFDEGRLERWERTSCLYEAWWIFWMWVATLFLQFLWIFYGMVLTCRRVRGRYLYEEAATMPVTIYLLFFMALGLTATFHAFWGESGILGPAESHWAPLILSGAALCVHIALGVAVRAFEDSTHELLVLNKRCDLVWNQLLTHNGLAALATWESVVTAYSIVSVLKERTFLPAVAHFECALALSFVMLYVLVWTLLDLFFTRRALYYVFLPYLVAIVTFASGLVANRRTYTAHVHENLSLVLSGVFLAMTTLFFVVKVIVVIFRGRYPKSSGKGDKDDVRSVHDQSVEVMRWPDEI